METNNNTQNSNAGTSESINNEKTQVYNVVILDKSGSMTSIVDAAIDGFNETLNGMCVAQETHKDHQQHYITLGIFCGHGCQMVYTNTPVAEAQKLDHKSYVPCCTTPLLDAMGQVLNQMYEATKNVENKMVAVTIITDGMENASREYNFDTIKKLVSRLEEEGWTFAYIGANQDALEVASKMNIDIAINFEAKHDSTMRMWENERSVKASFFQRLCDYETSEDYAFQSDEERKEMRRRIAKEEYSKVGRK